MVKKEFNLSKWVISEKGEPKLYLERDIKKFIKELKDCQYFEGTCKICKIDTLVDMESDCINCRINKIAGSRFKL